MHTREISKGNASYLKLNKVSHDASKRHVIPPRHVACGRCGHVDSVEGRTLEIRNVLRNPPHPGGRENLPKMGIDKHYRLIYAARDAADACNVNGRSY